MLRIAGKTAGPIGLKFFVDTQAIKCSIFFSMFFKNLFFTGNAGSFS